MPRTSQFEHYRREVSRVEGFSDAVFAFALTLLVVSLEAPKTFHDLLQMMRGIPAFAICFAILYQVWWRHYRFFRTYDLEDGYVIALTGILLFVVLAYVYPLKFLWSLPFAGVEGRRITDEVITQAQVPLLYAIYGAGVVAVFSILAFLYGHAYRLREELELTAREVLDARVQIYRNVGIAGFGALSILTAAITAAMAPNLIGMSGLLYFGIGIVEWKIGEFEGREQKKIAASITNTSP